MKAITPQTEAGKDSLGAIVQLMLEQKGEWTKAALAEYALAWSLEDSEASTISQSYDERIESFWWNMKTAEGWSDAEANEATNEAWCNAVC